MKSKISITLNSKILNSVDSFVDGISIRNRSQAIEHLLQSAISESKTAVILAGGKESDLMVKGTDTYRFSAKVGKKTVLELSVHRLKEHGFNHIILIGRKKIIIEMFSILGNGDLFGISLDYIEETVSEGSFSSLKLAKDKIHSSFLVVYADLVYDMDLSSLWSMHMAHPGSCTLMVDTHSEPLEKGTVKMEGQRIVDFEQKSARFKSFLSFCSIFAADPEILNIPGKSIEMNLFPYMIKEKMLYGHITSGWNVHIHERKDIEKIKNI